jgi:hypothetical protein
MPDLLLIHSQHLRSWIPHQAQKSRTRKERSKNLKTKGSLKDNKQKEKQEENKEEGNRLENPQGKYSNSKAIQTKGHSNPRGDSNK